MIAVVDFDAWTTWNLTLHQDISCVVMSLITTPALLFPKIHFWLSFGQAVKATKGGLKFLLNVQMYLQYHQEDQKLTALDADVDQNEQPS